MSPAHLAHIKTTDMTNILVPTDFTPASLDVIDYAVRLMNRKVNIVLFHVFKMPFYHQDLIRPKYPSSELLNDDFRKRCMSIKQKHGNQIQKIELKCMQGDTRSVFKHFLEANNIHIIVCPENYHYHKIHPLSLNPIPFFRKSGLPLLERFAGRTTRIDNRVQEQESTSAGLTASAR
jgi:Universal stress protein family